MAAIRELKPSYRQDRRLRRAQTAPRPEEDVELVLPPVEDTTLHYGGSPLMQPEIVLDPNSLPVVAGSDTSYKTEDWLAIGLATENTEGANTNTVQEGIGGNPVGRPLDGSGGVHQPPVGGQVGYTEVGPSRAALYFDLSGIPTDAIITEATLELVPYDSDPGDLYGEGTVGNTWPAEGVNLEILNLPQDSTPDATWNTKTGESLLVPFDVGAGQVTVPDPGQRWWRTVGGILPPNPIGVGQNTRRFDLPEPADLFENQINPGNFTVTGSNTIDGDPGDPEEYYGHIGYGISGGGYAVNIDPANPSVGHPTFSVSKIAWDNQQSGTPVNDFSVSVLNEVLWANTTGNRQCNFLVRASHWEDNTTAQGTNPEEQLTFPDNLPITEVSLTTAHISDTAGGTSILEAEQSDILHVVDDASGDPLEVEYVWQIEVPYVVLDPPTFVMNGTPGSIKEGDTIALSSFQINRNGTVDVNPNDEITLEYILGGSTVATFNWNNGTASPDTSFTIPQASEGDTLRARMTVTNSVDPDGAADTQTAEQDLGAIVPDDAGTVTVTIDGNPTAVAEGSTITARATSTGVANPQYRFELRFPESSDVFVVRDFDVSDNADFEVPQVGSAGGEFRIRVVMNNSADEQVDTDLTSAISIIDVPEIGADNQMKFQYNAARGAEGDRFGNVVTFGSKSGTLGENFTDSEGRFPTETTESGGDFNVVSMGFFDLMDPDDATLGAYAKIKFVGSGAAADDRALRWAEHFHGIQLTIRNSSGSVVSTHIFSGENAQTLGYRINEGDPDGNSDGVILWMNTSFPQSPNIPTPTEMRTIRQNIFDNCTQTDNEVDLVFGESEFFFDIDYIPIPAAPDDGDVIDIFDDLGVPRNGSITHPANGNSSSIVAFRVSNFDGAIQNPGGWLGPDGGQGTSVAAFLVQLDGSEGNIEVTDRNIGSGFSFRPEGVLDTDQFVYDNMRGTLDGDEHGEAGTSAGPFLLNVSTHPDNSDIDPPITYSNINVGYWTSAMDTDGIYDAANDTLPDPSKTFQATFLGFNVFLSTPIGSNQIAVVEVIRPIEGQSTGEIVGRWNLGDSNANASNKVHTLYPTKLAGDGGSPWQDFYKPTTWRVGDIICISVIPSTALDSSTRFYVS